MSRAFLCIIAIASLLSACKTSSAAPDEGAPAATPSSPIAPATAASSADGKSPRVVHVKATAKGFEPAKVTLKQGESAVLAIERVTESKCMRAFKMPWMAKAHDVAVGETWKVKIPTDRVGGFSYSCWMDMLFGRIEVVAR